MDFDEALDKILEAEHFRLEEMVIFGLALASDQAPKPEPLQYRLGCIAADGLNRLQCHEALHSMSRLPAALFLFEAVLARAECLCRRCHGYSHADEEAFPVKNSSHLH